MEKLLEAGKLNCPVCMEIFDKKVFQCQNDHAICENCFESKKWICNPCHVHIDGKAMRNSALEGVLDFFEVKCPNKGCSIMVNIRQLKSHQLHECKYRIKSIELCKLMGYVTCSYEISVPLKNKEELLLHLRSEHSLIIRSKFESDLKTTVTIILENFVDTSDEKSMWTPVIINFEDGFENNDCVPSFLVYTRMNQKEGIMAWNVLWLTSPSPPAEAFGGNIDALHTLGASDNGSTMEIKLKGAASLLKWWGKPVRLDCNLEQDPGKFLFSLPIQLIKENYLRNNMDLHFEVRIKPAGKDFDGNGITDVGDTVEISTQNIRLADATTETEVVGENKEDITSGDGEVNEISSTAKTSHASIPTKPPPMFPRDQAPVFTVERSNSVSRGAPPPFPKEHLTPASSRVSQTFSTETVPSVTRGAPPPLPKEPSSSIPSKPAPSIPIVPTLSDSSDLSYSITKAPHTSHIAPVPTGPPPSVPPKPDSSELSNSIIKSPPSPVHTEPLSSSVSSSTQSSSIPTGSPKPIVPQQPDSSELVYSIVKAPPSPTYEEPLPSMSSSPPTNEPSSSVPTLPEQPDPSELSYSIVKAPPSPVHTESFPSMSESPPGATCLPPTYHQLSSEIKKDSERLFDTEDEVQCSNCRQYSSPEKLFYCLQCKNFVMCSDCYGKRRHTIHVHALLRGKEQFDFISKCLQPIVDDEADCQVMLKALYPTEEAKDQQHLGVNCTNCDKKPMLGLQFKCMQCDNFSLCKDCIGLEEQIHKEHIFAALLNSRQNAFLRSWEAVKSPKGILE